MVDKPWSGWWYGRVAASTGMWLQKRPWLHICEEGAWVKPVYDVRDGAWRAHLEGPGKRRAWMLLTARWKPN